MPEKQTSDFHSGFISLIGRPNVGKSTLLNALLGSKVSITSAKPQTTRNRILGIKSLPSAQMIFLDTPGIHRARSLLNVQMVKTALSSLSEVDIVLYLVEPEPFIGDEDRYILENLEGVSAPMVLVINKIDLKPKEQVLPVIELFRNSASFSEIVPVSAKKGDGLKLIEEIILRRLPPGPLYYPPDMITDLPERFIAAEIIREKIFINTHQEVPYATAVVVEDFKEDEERGLISILAVIYVEQDSQKGIIIGRQGSMLKKIGQTAREELSRILGADIFLKLWVKVEKNWRKNPALLDRLGYTTRT